MKIKIVLIYLLISSCFVFSQIDLSIKFFDAKNLFDNRIYSEAYQIFSEIKREAPFDFDRLPLVYFYLGEIKFIQGKHAEAAFDFENFVAKFPLDKNLDLVLFRLGTIYFSLNKFQLSRKYFEKLITEKPNNEFLGTANFWIAESYFNENDFVNAEYFYLRAIKNYQTNELIEQTLFSLGFLYERLGAYDKAEIYYDKLLFEYPESKISPFALARVSLSYYKLGKYQKAINRLTAPQLERLNEKDLTEARYILANCYYRLGNFTEASNVFKSLLDLSSNRELTRQIRYGYSWSLYQENKIEKAHQIMLQLTSEDDSIAERSTYWLGFFSKAMKKNLQAINEFKLYLKRFPVYRYADLAKFEIGMLYYLEKRFKEAEDYLFVALENSRNPKIRAKSSLILANIKLDRNDFLEAKTFFESAVSELEDEDDDMIIALTGLGMVNYFMNKLEPAKYIFLNILSRKNVTDVDKVKFYLAETYFNLGYFSESANEYEYVLKQSKSIDLIRAAHYGLIYANFNLKNYNYVIPLIQSYTKKYQGDKRNSELKLRLADSYYAIKDYTTSSQLYKDYFDSPDLNRDSEYAYYQYAQTLYKAGNIQSAINEFANFQKKFPQSRYADESQYTIAWIKFRQGLYDNCIAEYLNLIQNYPKSNLIPLAYTGIGDAYFNKSMYSEAINYYNVVLTEFKNTPYVVDAINGIQYCYVVQGKIGEAAKTISDFVYSNPSLENIDKLFIKKGDLYLSQRDYHSAINSYREFITTFPKSKLIPSAYYSIAKADIQLGLFAEALKSLSNILENYSFSDAYDDAILEAGNIYRMMNEFENSILMYDKLIAELPNSQLVPEAYYWKGKSLLEMSDVSKAMSNFQMVIDSYQKSPYFSRALYELGKINYIKKYYDIAIDYLKRVTELRNDELAAESQFILGEIFFNQEKYDEAITNYLRLKYAFAGHLDWLTQGLFKAAESYEKINNKLKAKELYREVQKINPTSELGKQAKKRADKIR